jgi:Fe2+ transport system protein B
VVVIAFDLAARASFDHVQYWIDFVHLQGDFPCILIGTKDDLLENDNMAIEAAAFAQQVGIEFFATSAFTGKGVEGALIAVESLAATQPVKVKTAVFVPTEDREHDDGTSKKRCC